MVGKKDLKIIWQYAGEGTGDTVYVTEDGSHWTKRRTLEIRTGETYGTKLNGVIREE